MLFSVLLYALCGSVFSVFGFPVFGRVSRRAQRGYSLLLVCFLAAAMVIATWAAVPDLLTESRREKEEEMIWRGEQYARAVRLYYRKNGRFPQSIEELVERKTSIRFLRQAYKDPMNTKDGEWRLIYVGPNGQLIGSLKSTMLGGFGNLPRPGAPGTPAAGTGIAGSTPTTTPVVTSPLPSSGSTSGSQQGTGRVFGGSIIGVGSTIARPSIKVYKGGTTYREWEFLWDPTQDAAIIGTPGQQPRPGTPPPPPPRPR
jgi:hypothetical protein